MDVIFVEGVAATLSAIIVFGGSIFLLIMMVTGPKLAYYVTASVTLAMLVIMGVVWSINQLGPVGELPEFKPVGAAGEPSQIDFGPAAQYPESPWREPDPEDEQEQTLKSEVENAGAEVVEQQIQEGETVAYEVTADTDSTRLLEQDDTTYGAVTFTPVTEGEGEAVVAVLRLDPGDPLGQARMITAGAFILLVLHLFGLSRAEKRATRRRAAEEEAS